MVFLDIHIFQFFIIYCGMGSDVRFFLVIICPVQILRIFQLQWKFVVGPRNIVSFYHSAMALAGYAFSQVSAYVPNFTLKCFAQSRVRSIIIFLGYYDWQIPLLGGKAIIHKTTNRIISIIICTGTLFNGTVIHIFHASSFITIICLIISGTCYTAVVVFIFYQHVIDLICLRDSYGRLAWYRILGIEWRWSRVRQLILHVYIWFMILYCIYLGHSGETVLITDLQFETKSGRKQRKLFTRGISFQILSKISRIGNP